MAAQSDRRPARYCVALASPRLVGNLCIRLMSPLARRTPTDQERGPRAYSPDERREFLMGCAAYPWRADETRIRCLASHSVPLHATAGLSAHAGLAHLPAKPDICDRHDRSWRSRSTIRRASCSRPRMDRASCPRCGMALASLSSHHRLCSRCGRINLPIVLIGATRPPLWAATIGLLLVDDFQRIARGRHRDGSCQHSRILHDHPVHSGGSMAAVYLFAAAPQADGAGR